MPRHALHPRSHALVALALLITACAGEVAAPTLSPSASPLLSYASRDNDDNGRGFRFEPLPASAPCGAPGGVPGMPFLLPPGFKQVVITEEGDGGTIDLFDMLTHNETGPQAGRFLYRTHETRANGQVSETDLRTGVTRIVAQRADWERFDGIAWTPWGTVLAAEEVVTSALKDPTLPAAKGGHVYEINPKTGQAVLRAAVGSRSHEGLRFDPAGNLYGISEASPPTGGYIYKFVPDRRGDLSSGKLYALKIDNPTADRTGRATWVLLDREAVKLDSDAEATRVGATGYGRPEDVEIATSTGSFFSPWILFVAITSEDRVLAIDLRPGGSNDDDDRGGARSGGRAFVYDYVRAGVNAPVGEFDAPDNLALDKAGNLYITEDPSTPPGADIWAAVPGRGTYRPAKATLRFASLTDCEAEPTGVYFDLTRSILYVNVQHRGPEPVGLDLTLKIFPKDGDRDRDEDDDNRRAGDDR
jgi:uncharacterized protein